MLQNIQAEVSGKLAYMYVGKNTNGRTPILCKSPGLLPSPLAVRVQACEQRGDPRGEALPTGLCFARETALLQHALLSPGRLQ